MKAILLLSLSLCCLPLVAQDAPDEKVDRLISIMQSETVFIESMEAALEMQKESPMAAQLPAGFFEAFLEKAKKEAYAAMLPQFRELYKSAYTEEEVDFLLEMYSSPIGKKIIMKQGKVVGQASLIGQKWGEKAGMEVAQELMSGKN